LISAKVGLIIGFLWNIKVSSSFSSFESLEYFWGFQYKSSRCLAKALYYLSVTFASPNGFLPVTILKRETPRAKTSTG
jgi:hypothetical protein